MLSEIVNTVSGDLPKKQQPFSIEAERSVLGGLIADDRAWDKIADRVVESDFRQIEHRIIFATIRQLANQSKPIDIVTVPNLLSAQGELEKVGGSPYIFALAKDTPSAANIIAYADIVREHSILRQLIKAATDIIDSAYQTKGESSRDLLDKAEQRIFNIAECHSMGNEPASIQELLSTTYQRIDTLYQQGRMITGIATGFSEFDHMTSGLQAGELIVIAGRPSMGKTAFAMNIVEYASVKAKRPILVFSMEMPAESLTMRMMSSLQRINQQHLRTGRLTNDDWNSISSAMGMLAEAKLYIDDTPALTPTELRSRARRIARQHGGLSAILIDYLQLMQSTSKNDTRANEISEISRALKALAIELQVPVIALSQLNRSLEQRHDRRPVMSDLRESGAIEQDADLIAFIYRDEVYNKDSSDTGMAEIIISKQRNGPVGKVYLRFFGEYTRFDNFSEEVKCLEPNS